MGAVASTLAAFRHARDVDVDEILDKSMLFDFIDTMQIEFNELHEAIQRTWFVPVA